ncbi:phosphate-starvation-inducible PsiE family protein [uncultured Psychroserpens sp.]|uniref:phosphate-starvation-inducible PsiE family protein n=1 Tax=uncultured Psychroserpens sp. TaxID=255436 RepID=UPI0026112CC7|nr:phosphate-starvation-inducible PsiE family protein [uncultured Psychroserpens sp.]
MNKLYMIKIVERIERVIILTLLFSLLAVVLYATIVFISLLFGGIIVQFQDSFSQNNILTHLHKIFGGFMLVLIGVELVHTVKMYLKEDVVHVEIVLLVALIGISRHVIDLDFKHLAPLTLIGISSLIIVLSSGYYLIKKGMRIKK